MSAAGERLAIALLLTCTAGPVVSAQEPAAPTPCRDRPCSVLVDWTRQGGVTSLRPDRRYGNPATLGDLVKSALRERGYRLAEGEDVVPRIVLRPTIRNAMCDQLPGTATDNSCQAVTEIETRVDGPEELAKSIDLPSRIRNRCGADQVMPVHRLAAYVAEYIGYAIEGKANGEKRPVARC